LLHHQSKCREIHFLLNDKRSSNAVDFTALQTSTMNGELDETLQATNILELNLVVDADWAITGTNPTMPNGTANYFTVSQNIPASFHLNVTQAKLSTQTITMRNFNQAIADSITYTFAEPVLQEVSVENNTLSTNADFSLTLATTENGITANFIFTDVHQSFSLRGNYLVNYHAEKFKAGGEIVEELDGSLNTFYVYYIIFDSKN